MQESTSILPYVKDILLPVLGAFIGFAGSTYGQRLSRKAGENSYRKTKVEEILKLHLTILMGFIECTSDLHDAKKAPHDFDVQKVLKTFEEKANILMNTTIHIDVLMELYFHDLSELDSYHSVFNKHIQLEVKSFTNEIKRFGGKQAEEIDTSKSEKDLLLYQQNLYQSLRDKALSL